MERGSACPRLLWAATPLLPGLAVSAEEHAAPPRTSPSPGGPAQTLNFSRVQNLRRLLPAAPSLTRDARSPAVSVQPSIRAQSRSQLGRAERRASRGCGRRDLGTTPGAGTPGARAARGQGGGSWCLRGRAERRCRQGGRLPMDVCVGRRRIEEQKEEDVGGATVAPSSRRRLGARAGCSAVNDERDTHSRSPALLPRPGFSAHPGSSGHGAWRARSPLPDSPWSRGPGARGPRLARHGDPPPPSSPPLSTCPFRIPSLGARATP